MSELRIEPETASVITPEAYGRVHWTKVLIDTFGMRQSESGDWHSCMSVLPACS